MRKAPDWEKLSGEWEGHDIGFVAEVDCTEEGKPLCDTNGVKGFPTLKYGDPSNLEDYQGGRTYDDLSKFATDNLKPVCSPSNLGLCDDDKKKQINELMAKSDDELAAEIAEMEKKMEAIEETFKTAVEGLQKTYQKLTETKEADLVAVKDAGLGMMKSVKASKAKAAKAEL